MDGLTLLKRARKSGLAVTAEDGKLVIRGPKRAEAVARLLIENKPEVLAALTPDGRDAAWWRREFAVRTVDRLLGARTQEEAKLLAFNQLAVEWHRCRAVRAPEWQCAGCDGPIGGAPALALADANRVHFETLACILRYGERWRSEATAGLQALGLDPPTGSGSL